LGGTLRSNPFTYGNPISDPRRFFGRAREVEQIFGRLRNEEFESSSVVGDRRIGKTSLLNYLADPGVRSAHGLESDSYIFVYVDLQMVDAEMGPDKLWRRWLSMLRRRYPDPNVVDSLRILERAERLDTFDLDELFQQVDDGGKHVVFLLDEFERVTENENFGPDFYYGLRSLMIHHRVALVTSSRLELIELCHSDAVKSSPFFNVFANINLRLFAPTDCRQMLSRSLEGTDTEFNDFELNQVFDLAGLHPYFLQAAAWMLFESYQMKLDPAGRGEFLAEKFRAEAIPHMIDYWDNSGDYQKIVMTAAALLESSRGSRQGFLLEELRNVFSRAEPCLEVLMKRGLIMPIGDRYRLFSSVFGPWILSQISAEAAEEQSYHEWLAENGKAMERVTGKQSGQLKEILPRIGVRYRKLILTWASDPQTVTAMAGLLNTVLTLVN
jgi:AAA-like domain